MSAQLQIGEVEVEVVHKAIKNLHLSVHPPTGRVRIAAPERMSLDSIRVFAISKLPWIRRQQDRLVRQEREPPREWIERESHFVWGRRCLLRIVEVDGAPSVELAHRRLILRVRPGTPAGRRQEIVDAWYREQVREALPALLATWESRLGVSTRRVFVQRMKTKWGSCNAKRRTIRLNTDLAKKPPECLEYVVVHELAHLLDPTHGESFRRRLDTALPDWEQRRGLLNELPLSALA
jgi:predicted metal-dependent hydrolase